MPQLTSSLGKAAYEKHVLPRVIGRVDRLIAVSEATKSSIQRALNVPGENISVVPNAISDPMASSAPGQGQVPGERYLLAFGHIEPRKNLESILPVMDRLVSDPGWPVRKLVIAGRDLGSASSLRERYRAFQGRFDLEILCDVDEELKASLLAHADCLLAPSLLEGFGLVPLEALVVGTPVVASDVPAHREVLGGDLVDPSDTGAFADKIRAVVRDPRSREKALSLGQARREVYSWASSARLLHEAYEQTLEAFCATPRPMGT